MAKKVDGLLSRPQFVKDLPIKRHEKTDKYSIALKPLLSHKKAWALVATFAKSSTANTIASMLRKDRALLPGNGNFEFAVRGLEDGSGLYAQFLG